MVTKYDKAFAGVLIPLLLYVVVWLLQQTGAAVTPEVEQAIETILWWAIPILTGAGVLAIPNKGAIFTDKKE